MASLKLLIVEDEINIAKTIAATFNSEDYETQIYTDGLQAWENIYSKPNDIVFLDIMLPGIDGMEILKRIHENNIQTSVVMITAFGSIDYAVQAMKYGAVDFLQKPLDPSGLRNVVQKIRDRIKLNESNAHEYEQIIELVKLEISKREYHNAHDLIKKAISLKQESAEAYNLLGAIREIMGDNISAAQSYQLAIKFDKNYKPALDNLDRITSLEANSADLFDILAAMGKREK